MGWHRWVYKVVVPNGGHPFYKTTDNSLASSWVVRLFPLHPVTHEHPISNDAEGPKKRKRSNGIEVSEEVQHRLHYLCSC